MAKSNNAYSRVSKAHQSGDKYTPTFAPRGPKEDWQVSLNRKVEAWAMKNIAPAAIKAGRAVRSAASGWGTGGASVGDVARGIAVLKNKFGRR